MAAPMNRGSHILKIQPFFFRPTVMTGRFFRLFGFQFLLLILLINCPEWVFHYFASWSRLILFYG